jgi:cobalt-precorrin 5A hydrolase/precorrin-3B C17-methyltransferase
MWQCRACRAANELLIYPRSVAVAVSAQLACRACAPRCTGGVARAIAGLSAGGDTHGRRVKPHELGVPLRFARRCDLDAWREALPQATITVPTWRLRAPNAAGRAQIGRRVAAWR